MRSATRLVRRASTTAASAKLTASPRNVRPRTVGPDHTMAAAATNGAADPLGPVGPSTKTIATHSGSFHCDEALGCYLLRQTDEFAGARIVRSRDPEVLKGADVVIDVGAVYDPGESCLSLSRGVDWGSGGVHTFRCLFARNSMETPTLVQRHHRWGMACCSAWRG
jgi:hypothetical protein